MKINQFLLLLLILFSSCRIGPKYTSPEVNLPPVWKTNPHSLCEENNDYNIDYWWEIFDDEVLNVLESQAIQYNYNLEIAYEKMLEARALAGVARADLFPQLNLMPSYSDYASLIKLNLPSLPSTASSPLVNSLQSPYRAHQLLYLMPLNLNYEVDLWGKIRNQYSAALLTTEAQEQAYIALLLSLTADLASNYYQLRALDSQIDVLEKVIESTQHSYDLTQSMFKKGIVTALDVNQANISYVNAKATYEDTLRQRTIAENQIAVLIGQSPSQFTIVRSELRSDPPHLPPNIPSTILLQRPDIAQAERNLAAENAQVGVAYGSCFPTLSLTGILGYSSPDLRQFLQWISRYWLLGANSNQVVWDGGRLDSNILAAYARFDQANSTYKQQVLIALQEVENALINIEQRDKQYKQLILLYESNKNSNLLLNNRFKQGLSTSLDVTLTQVNELNAELQVVNVLALRYISLIELIKALGGRWDVDVEEQDTKSEDETLHQNIGVN